MRITGLSLTLALCAAIAPVCAQAVAQHYDLNIPRQSLDSALNAFAQQTGLQIARLSDAKAGKTLVGPLKGEFSVGQALDSMLTAQALSYKVISDDTIAVMAATESVPTNRSAGDATVTNAGEPNSGLEEVVVTATRSSQKADKVPVSLSAYNGQSIEYRGAHDAEDLLRLTPGVTFTKTGFGDTNNLSIRGVNSTTGAGTVGIYIDDTPIQITNLGYAPRNVYPELFDLDRVEVLRGPQGTLFGAGSEGGTVRFITPAPSLTTYSGYDRAEIGSIDGGGLDYEIGAAAGGPIVDGTLGFRISLDYRREGGYVDRVDRLTGATLDKNSNREDQYVVRASMLWAASDAIKITPSVMFQSTRLNNTYNWWEQLSRDGSYKSGEPQGSPVPDRFTLPSVKFEYTASGFDVISNTSYFYRLSTPTVDYSGVVPGDFAGLSYLPQFPNYLATGKFQNEFRTFVEEARIQSNDNDARLKWVGGVYFNNSIESAQEQIIDTHFSDLINFLYGGTLEQVTGVPLLDGQYTYLQSLRTRNRETAVFGELGYELFPGLRVSAGARVSSIKLDASNYVTGAFNFGTIVSGGDSTERAVTPKYNVSYQVNPDELVYATVAKGFRPGGTNVAIGSSACSAQLGAIGYTSAPQSYDSDSLWSYEAGIKSRLFDGSTELTGSVFHIKWSGIQQSILLETCGLSFTSNLGQAISNGFDLSLNQRVGSFTYLAQLGYTDAYYTKDLTLGPGVKPLVRVGNALEVQPWTISVGAQYDLIVGGHQSYARADYSGRLGHKREADQDPSTSSYTTERREVQATDLINVRVGMLFGGFNLSVFATNIADSHPVQSGYTTGGTAYFRDVTVTPRTVGLTGTYRY